MLKLWKPLQIIRTKKGPIVFDEIGRKYKHNDKEFRPFVIFYDSVFQKYWYVKSRDAVYENKKTGEQENKFRFPEEYYVSHSVDGGLFNKDSLVDCSQIFVMDKDELESLIDFNSKEFEDTPILLNFCIFDILDKIYKCIDNVPPNISILEVCIDKKTNQTKGNNLYLSETKQKRILENKKVPITKKDLDEKYLVNSKFENGIKFCLMFLKEYYPNEINNFLKKQNINLKDYNKFLKFQKNLQSFTKEEKKDRKEYINKKNSRTNF